MKLVMLQFEEMLVPLHKVRIVKLESTGQDASLVVRFEDSYRTLGKFSEPADLKLMLDIIAHKIEQGCIRDAPLIRLTSDILKLEFDRRRALESVGLSNG